MTDLSVVIITKDEEHDLPACLDSVKGLASEVIVVDNRSSDRTVEIAKHGGAVVRERVFEDYAPQKQFALEQATKGWILSIDADERVTPELARELEARLSAGPAEDAFLVCFEVEFMGRVLRFGGMGSEKHLRVIRRGKGRFVGGGLHEGIEVAGSVGRLRGRIRHIPYRDLGEYLAKLDRYTSLAAGKRLKAGRRSSPLDHLRPCWELFARLVLKLGLLDGSPGLVYAGLSAFHTWVKYVKLRELEERP